MDKREKLLTKWDFYKSRGLRVGQSLINALADVDTALYRDIRNTEADCYYSDDKVPQTLDYIKERI